MDPLAYVAAATLLAAGIQVSGGLDTRYTHHSDPTDDTLMLEGAFLNLRKVWSDEYGDRWIGVAQADFDDNFQRIRPYQVYLQYKGPLGRWNVRAGHFLLPFGLLSTYDTERLLLRGLEGMSLGIRKDTGLEALGRIGPWDYALAVTEGVGDRRFLDVDDNKAVTGRAAYVADDWQVGFSSLIGRILRDPEFAVERGVASEQRYGLDATWARGRLTLRWEGIGGLNADAGVGGGLVLADYAITPKLELNTRAAYWHENGDRPDLGVGVTYQVRPHVFLRLADSYEFRTVESNTLSLQVYLEFFRQL